MRPVASTVLSSLTLASLVVLGCRATPSSSESEARAETPPAAKVAEPPPAKVEPEAPLEPPSTATEPKPEPEPKADAPVSLASFASFLGLRHGDRRERVHELFGSPDYLDDEDMDMDTLHYVVTEDNLPDDGPPGSGDAYLFAISVNKPSQWVYTVAVRKGDYAAEGIEDPLLRFVGSPLGEIEATFGKPTRSHAGFNAYEYVDEARGLDMQIQFICYEFDQFACNELWVMWFEP